MTSLTLPDIPTAGTSTDIVPMYVVDVQDCPTLTVFNQPIRMTQLIRQAHACWGDNIGRLLKTMVADAFQGFSYDRDHPRELFLDLDANRIWAFCYHRPKRQDPEGKLLTKTVIQLTDRYAVADLVTQHDPTWTFDHLQQLLESDPMLVASGLPLLGDMACGPTFIQEQQSRQQFIHVGFSDGTSTRVTTDIRWLLAAEEVTLNNAGVAQHVTRREFYDGVRGKHHLVPHYVRLLNRYITWVGVRPHHFIVRSETQTNYALRYTLNVEMDGKHYPVHGGLFVASEKRTDLQ